ncbi:MAG: PD-(D/E)XK nuclease family protein [Alphaproteobacteria bacterium]|nr:PD-(D/E)XK nuclease family protein [Alphaproteobacteria bacterium]
MPNIYNVPIGCSLVDILAEHLLNKYKNNLLGLTDVTVFLPNRRAVRELRNAFVRLHGMNATLLPQILPLGSVDEDGFFFSGNEIKLPPVISSVERLMIFIRLICARPDNFKVESLTTAQACYLANELSTLIDMVNNERLKFEKLNDIVPEEYASHWQNTLQFLKIITEFYPKILEERNLSDIGDYNNKLLSEQNKNLQKNPSEKEIIVAGTTATFPAMKELVKTISELKNGSVYLSGIDKFLDDSAWDMIEETHPQFELKQLLEFLQISRHDIPDAVSHNNSEREKLFSEVMRPAESSDSWLSLNKDSFSAKALDGLKLIECRDSKEEALIIAAIMRHNLETPEKTTALVTQDRNLARCVSNELLRWGIKADDSAGIPLSQTPQGIFLRLIAKVCEEDFSPLSLLSLYKHPFTCAGKTNYEIRRQIREYEKSVLRNRNCKKIKDNDFITHQKSLFNELHDLMNQPKASFKELLNKHLQLAEFLATSKDKNGADVLWCEEEGEVAASLMGNLLEHADTLGEIKQGQYADLFGALLNGTIVRSKYGAHPRLRILGPIEARLCSFDCVIVSGLSEGIMPANSSSGAWLSRPMKEKFGYPLPEKSIGVLAHDFCEMCAAKEVYLTRSDRVQNTPMVKSRWWMRLETVLKAIDFDINILYQSPYTYWCRQLDRTQNITPIEAPHPAPPLESRPRELWASDMERLICNPYSVYASKILKLKKINDFDQTPDAVDMGNIVHNVLEQFYKQYPEHLPQNAKKIMEELAENLLNENEIEDSIKLFWKIRIERMIDWILQKEENLRIDIKHTHCEVKGRTSFQSSGGEFIVGAKADRIDETTNGTVRVIDYKTGYAPQNTKVEKGYAPQLPIEGIIAQKGDFEEISAKPVESLHYWKLQNNESSFSKNVDDLLENYTDKLTAIIEHFDKKDSEYIVQPKYKDEYCDYIHLSRIKEWGVNSSDDD